MAAPHTAAPANDFALVWPLDCAQQFCRARPVRAPKLVNCFAHGQALPQRLPATGAERERVARIAGPFAVEGEAIAGERGVASTRSFHKPLGVKGKWKHSPFAYHACGRRVLEALGQALSHCSALGARTGRALQNCCALNRWQGECFAIRCRAVGRVREEPPRWRLPIRPQRAPVALMELRP